MYNAITRLIKQRSLIILYTNFESYYAGTLFTGIAKNQSFAFIVSGCFLKNTEIKKNTVTNQPTTRWISITKPIGKKFLSEKEMMVKELAKYGIQSVLTAPQDLSTLTINKYLRFKAKGWI